MHGIADDTAHGNHRKLPSIAALIRRNSQPSVPTQPTPSAAVSKDVSNDIERGSPGLRSISESHSIAASEGSSSGLGSSSNVPGQGLRRLSAHSRGVMHQRAANKYHQLSASFKSRSELKREEHLELPPWIVHPHDIWAQCWWGFILCTVIVTLFVEPYSLAFAAYPGLHPLTSPDTILAIIFMCVYSSDILLNFFVAFYEDGELVTDSRRIAAHYARWRLWVDLVTTIPFDWITLSAMGLQESNSTLAWYISLLRLLRLGRAYRLHHWVTFLTYNQKLSLLAFTLIRNFLMCFFVVHWAACGFYYIAKQSGFADTSWVGAASDWIGGATAIERYIYAMYWSTITFATVGYGDFHAYSVPEALFTVIYVFINIGVAAYIIGTITLLVVKGDEKTGAYRERLNNLDAYSSTHEIPTTLKNAMKGHLQLHFSSAESSDEAVLAVYPTTIRRRILRHLYIRALSSCWLFEGCKIKLLDAVLAASKVELYMPKVDVITEGDHVNELYILVAGQAMSESGNSLATTGHPESVMLESDGTTSVHGGSTRFLGPGDSAGEMAFFTETPCMESVRTLSLCRVLVIPRVVYATLANDFPISIRTVMDNLVARAEQLVEFEFPGAPDLDVESVAALELKFASNDSGRTVLPTNQPARPSPNDKKVSLLTDSSGMPLRPIQQQVLSNLLRVRALANHTRARLEQQQTFEFLNACSTGSLERMRLMLQQGCDVNCTDYDGRTGLMLAAGAGSVPAVRMLLVAGAHVNLSDRMGGSALLEAAKGGHEQVIELLRQKGAVLMSSGVNLAAHLCTAVFEGDVRLLMALLKAGANVNASDYDKRTSVHIAAADGNLPMVKVLVSAGADPLLTDRWGNTAVDEALRVGASTVVEYLMEMVADETATEAINKLKVLQTNQMLNAASTGQLSVVRQLLQRGCSPDLSDYDKRTALMLACANGHQGIVTLLLEAGANPNLQDNFGGTAMSEAEKAGHHGVKKQLMEAGASLSRSATHS